MKLQKTHLCFDTLTELYSHFSASTQTEMNFAFISPKNKPQNAPLIFWLSGLTCTEQNFITKSFIQFWVNKYQINVVVPDTSPRGEGVSDDPEYDLGMGAGFYVNATESPWKKNYQMYDYVSKELYELVEKNFSYDRTKVSLMGHSMGGHGALIMGLKEPEKFKKISAFAPISNPMQSPWGIKAFTNYLSKNQEQWSAYDASELILTTKYAGEILIDQGRADPFLETQLSSKHFIENAKKSGIKIHSRMHEGYDHSYYFIASFLEDHIRFHLEIT